MSKNDMLGGALAEVAGPLKDLLGKLAGKDGEMWLQALKRFLRKENPWHTSFPVWKTIQIGGKEKAELIAELEANGFKFCDWARDMLNQKVFTISPKHREIQLVRVTVEQLGLPDRATTREIWKRAQDLGLRLCPAEVGPYLRLQYPDQPMDEWLWIAMEQIVDSDGRTRVFSVNHGGGGRWLGTRGVHPESEWRADRTFVFVLPRV